MLRLLDSVRTARQQEFTNQDLQLCDILQQTGPQLGPIYTWQKLTGHTHASEG